MILILFNQFSNVYFLSPCPNSVLKLLHSENHILSSKECGECAKWRQYWYEHVAIVTAVKPPDAVKQALDIVHGQSAIDSFPIPLTDLARCLKGTADITAIDT